MVICYLKFQVVVSSVLIVKMYNLNTCLRLIKRVCLSLVDHLSERLCLAIGYLLHEFQFRYSYQNRECVSSSLYLHFLKCRNVYFAH